MRRVVAAQVALNADDRLEWTAKHDRSYSLHQWGRAVLLGRVCCVVLA
ncbi:MAG: hypothetical protein ACU0GG_14795 [Paracoccaceae bacterium]